MDPSAVVGALAKRFGSTVRPLSIKEKAIFSELEEILSGEIEIVETVRTLGFDSNCQESVAHDESDGEDSDADLGVGAMKLRTPTSSQSAPKTPQKTGHESSGSSYDESPTKKAKTETDDEYKQKAYDYMMCHPDGSLRAEP